jgi:cation diffusion facilitator CzcD-associated flavoprotein CzcO
MTDSSKTPLAGRQFDPEALHAKYLAEREKRLGTQSSPYIALDKTSVTMPSDRETGGPSEREPLTDEVDVVVVGGGFTGLITAARLRESGVEKVRVIEKGADVGGVWYWNQYPGIRCDVDSYVYLPLLEEVGTVPSEKYAEGSEILEHCRKLATKYDLYADACFGTQVTGVEWDDDSSRWIIRTDRNDRIRARFVCLGSGVLDLPKVPDLPGLQDFAGHTFHTSRWDYDYTGGDSHGGLAKLADKRVAVIGTAASAIQCVPVLAEYAKKLFVVQRTPSVVDKRDNRPTDLEWFTHQEPGWQKRRMDNFTAITSGVPQEVDLVADRTTKMLGAAGRPVDPSMSPQAVAEARLLGNYAKMEELRAQISTIVSDPDVAESLKPYYNLGCKRPQFSDVYLDTFNKANVTLVDTQGRGVDRLTRDGFEVDGTAYDVDCVVFATGFAGGLPLSEAGGFEVVGRRDVTLASKWRNGTKSLHGIHTNGFPNLFVIGGVSQAVLTINFSHGVDEQARHVAALISRCAQDDVSAMEVTPEAEDRWSAVIEAKAAERSKIDLECTPADHVDLFNSTYGGGPLEYFAILHEWLRDGFSDDVVLTWAHR